ncbi:hypothetical protein K490DRAFT_69208 [Saccharata proteae CBS 121410]|uniref:GPI anchored protein n=1 Tax=Saccharata proteae CBS 121410 TaxID=1314787 RepID=A0A9P4HR06_9PEZI|nr:hypothetical protein K490DRAFT_69208 [Saccharata proteae CBS 121410]
MRASTLTPLLLTLTSASALHLHDQIHPRQDASDIQSVLTTTNTLGSTVELTLVAAPTAGATGANTDTLDVTILSGTETTTNAASTNSATATATATSGGAVTTTATATATETLTGTDSATATGDVVVRTTTIGGQTTVLTILPSTAVSSGEVLLSGTEPISTATAASTTMATSATAAQASASASGTSTAGAGRAVATGGLGVIVGLVGLVGLV